MTYSFTLNMTEVDVKVENRMEANVTATLKLANAAKAPSGEVVGSYRAVVPSRFMAARGGPMAFTLRATNFLGHAGEATVAGVVKLSVAAPTLTIAVLPIIVAHVHLFRHHLS